MQTEGFAPLRLSWLFLESVGFSKDAWGRFHAAAWVPPAGRGLRGPFHPP